TSSRAGQRRLTRRRQQPCRTKPDPRCPGPNLERRWPLAAPGRGALASSAMSELEQLAGEAIAPHKARLQPSDGESAIALFMARRVRDAIEDIHVAHLPDDVMPEFNRSVRDAIVESLVAMRLAADDDSLADAARCLLSSPF